MVNCGFVGFLQVSSTEAILFEAQAQSDSKCECLSQLRFELWLVTYRGLTPSAKPNACWSWLTVVKYNLMKTKVECCCF